MIDTIPPPSKNLLGQASSSQASSQEDSFFKLSKSDQRAALQSLGGGDPAHLTQFFQLKPEDQRAAVSALISRHQSLLRNQSLIHSSNPEQDLMGARNAPPTTTPGIEKQMDEFVSKQPPHATRHDMENVALHAAPYVLGAGGALAAGATGIPEAIGLGGAAADLASGGLSVLGAGVGGGVGGAIRAGGEAAIGAPDAPQSWKEAEQQIYHDATNQMKLEGEGQIGGLALRGAIGGALFATEGAKFLRSPAGRALSALNDEMKTRLTVSELADSPIGHKIMEGGSIGILGNIRAQLAQRAGMKHGIEAARAVLNSIGNNVSAFKLGAKLGGNAVDLDNAIGLAQSGQAAFMKIAGEQHAQTLAEMEKLPAATLNKDFPLATWLRKVEGEAAKDVGSNPGREGVVAKARLRIAREIEANIPESVLNAWLADRPMQWNISLPDLERMRASLGMFQPGAQEFFPGIADSEAKKGYKAVIQTIESGESQLPQKINQLRNSGLTPQDVTKILDGWREYRSFVARGMRFYDNGFATRIMSANPLEAVQALMSGDPQKMQVLNRMMADNAATSPRAAREVRATRRMMQRAYLQDLIGSDLKTPATSKKAIGMEKSIAKAGEKLSEAHPEFVNALFNDAKSKQALNRFKQISQLLSRRQYPSEYSGRFALIEAALGAASVVYKSPIAMASLGASEAVTSMLALVAYSPTASKLVINSLQGRLTPARIIPNLIRAFKFAQMEDEDQSGTIPEGDLQQIQSMQQGANSPTLPLPASSNQPPTPPASVQAPGGF